MCTSILCAAMFPNDVKLMLLGPMACNQRDLPATSYVMMIKIQGPHGNQPKMLISYTAPPASFYSTDPLGSQLTNESSLRRSTAAQAP